MCIYVYVYVCLCVCVYVYMSMVWDQADSTPEDGGHSHELFDTNNKHPRKKNSDLWLVAGLNKGNMAPIDRSQTLGLSGGSGSLSGRWVRVSVWSVCKRVTGELFEAARRAAEANVSFSFLCGPDSSRLCYKGQPDETNCGGKSEQMAAGWSADWSSAVSALLSVSVPGPCL